MEHRFAESDVRKRAAIMVSREDHCLSDLLWRWRNGELDCDLTAVISNHPDHAEQVRAVGLPFHHVPVAPDSRPEAEQRVLDLLGDDLDLLVLARYMQILSPGFLEALGAAAINIHHSFLPAFVGAEPYRRAHERGVKLIGATAHYVTAELDAGPIIDQDVTRVSHRDEVEDLVRIGRDIERLVLARAVDRPPRRPRPARRRAHRRLLASAGNDAKLAGQPVSRMVPGMEQATLPRSAGASRRVRPPGPRSAGAGAGSRYARDPLGFLPSSSGATATSSRSASPTSAASSTSPIPTWSKRSSPASPSIFHAGEANATVLEPALGPNSVLTLDDEPHMRQRKLLLPPFHGERVQRYGELIERDHPAGDGELAGRRAVLDAPPHPADHPGGDPARRLRRPRRGAARALRAADRRLRPPGRPDHLLPDAAPQPRAAQPLEPVPALARGARRLHLRGDRPAPRRDRGWRSATTCSRCCSAPATRTARR